MFLIILECDKVQKKVFLVVLSHIPAEPDKTHMFLAS